MDFGTCWRSLHDDRLLLYGWTVSDCLHTFRRTVFRRCHGNVAYSHCFYIQTGTVTTQAILLSIPSMILVAGIMLSNNIRDLEQIQIGGRKTLAILVGRSQRNHGLNTLFHNFLHLDCCT